jgi:hypothetical protein
MRTSAKRDLQLHKPSTSDSPAVSSIYQEIRTKNLPGLGRHAVIDHILKQLKQGNHVSLAGPRFTGKSCLMRALVRRPELRETFQCVALCDLRHEVIDSNDGFYGIILRQLGGDLHEDAADWREFTEPSPGISAWKTLEDLVKGMKAESAKALIVLDGLDETAVSTSVDVNAWNNFTRLIDIGGAQFVCASRQRLGDLDQDPKSRSSLFFQRFQDPLPVPRVGLEELGTWLGDYAKVFDEGAKTELLGQTGGHPQLLGLFLQRLCPSATTHAATDVQAVAK